MSVILTAGKDPPAKPLLAWGWIAITKALPAEMFRGGST